MLELLRRGEPVELRLAGPCMRPWAFGGDTVGVAPLLGPPRRGWVVLIRDDDTLLAHRVLRVRPDRIETRGDLSTVPDPPWRPDQVVGRIVWASGRLGLRVPLGGSVAPLLGLVAAPLLRLAHRVVRSGRRGWRGRRAPSGSGPVYDDGAPRDGGTTP